MCFQYGKSPPLCLWGVSRQLSRGKENMYTFEIYNKYTHSNHVASNKRNLNQTVTIELCKAHSNVGLIQTAHIKHNCKTILRTEIKAFNPQNVSVQKHKT